MIRFAMVILIAMMAAGCNAAKILSQNSDGAPLRYDFRKSKWGDLINQVEWAEKGNRIKRRTERLLIYESREWDIPLEIVYCFDDRKRLRAAGYMVNNEVYSVDRMARDAVNLHGMPDSLNDGMTWRTNRSLIYWEGLVTRRVVRNYMKGGGALSSLVGGRQRKPIPVRWKGVWGYMDVDYLEQLMSEKFPMDELSWHEKRLFGALTPRGTVSYRGATLPSEE